MTSENYMKRKTGFLSVFLITAFLCVLFLTLSLSGNLKSLSSFLEKGTSGIQAVTYGIFQNLPFVSENARIKKLKDENLKLLSRVATFEKLKKENQALSDQFQTAYPSSMRLLKADIIGAPGFIPGVSVPNTFVLNKGAKDGLEVGQAVVVENNLVGVVVKVSANLSKADTINGSSFSFTARTQNGAVGIIKGGENLTINNIILSENIEPLEFIFTKGDISSDGVGIPPDLMVGKIISVEKNPSDLFQKAKVESLVNLTNLSTVFVYIQTE